VTKTEEQSKTNIVSDIEWVGNRERTTDEEKEKEEEERKEMR